MREEHTAAVFRPNNPRQSYAYSHELMGFSHHVLAVGPRILTPNYSKWVINVKSVRVGKQIMEWIWLEEGIHLGDMYDVFCNILGGSSLAGWIFEAIVTASSLAGWQSDKPTPQPIHIISNGCKPPQIPLLPLLCQWYFTVLSRATCAPNLGLSCKSNLQRGSVMWRLTTTNAVSQSRPL